MAIRPIIAWIAPITTIRPVRPGALLDPRRMGAAVV
jgi:hypothetical protein